MHALYIVHQSGAPRHFSALSLLKERGKINRIVYIEFNIAKQFFSGLKRLKPLKVVRAVRNACYMVLLLLRKDRQVILGMAPYDKFVFFAEILSRRHDLVYFTSWPFWDWKTYPIDNGLPFLRSRIMRKWSDFLAVNRTVCVSDLGYKNYIEATANRRVTQIPHSVNRSVFFPRKNQDRSDETLKVVFVGKLLRAKGLEELACLAKELEDSLITFSIVGDGPDAGIISDTVKLPNVSYYGYISNEKKLSDIYRSHDVLLLPTHKELFGIVLIEAMACGVVPIATETVGPAQLITHGKNGYLVEIGNWRQILSHLVELQQEPLLLDALRQKALEKAADYDIERCASLWESVLS